MLTIFWEAQIQFRNKSPTKKFFQPNRNAPQFPAGRFVFSELLQAPAVSAIPEKPVAAGAASTPAVKIISTISAAGSPGRRAVFRGRNAPAPPAEAPNTGVEATSTVVDAAFTMVAAP